MDVGPVDVYYYRMATGECPFLEWRESQETSVRLMVVRRLARIRTGLFGDYKFVGNGVFELRLHAGAGYRIYFGRAGSSMVIVLQAGYKKEQSADIEMAQARWKDYLVRRNP